MRVKKETMDGARLGGESDIRNRGPSVSVMCLLPITHQRVMITQRICTTQILTNHSHDDNGFLEIYLSMS